MYILEVETWAEKRIKTARYSIGPDIQPYFAQMMIMLLINVTSYLKPDLKVGCINNHVAWIGRPYAKPFTTRWTKSREYRERRFSRKIWWCNIAMKKAIRVNWRLGKGARGARIPSCRRRLISSRFSVPCLYSRILSSLPFSVR